ncbi:hypothetical protein CEP54_002093 [Fusarium duplospermum]|uniref:Heterokaryon incompatibility domain-containing protein n=1 Tax=Fusarium duplospermum TaxID=1325734 RepID=A0A428QWC0_9HYPO|nr:hypothetical protein CEP54_002093 [Fusarium duplospermum]
MTSDDDLLDNDLACLAEQRCARCSRIPLNIGVWDLLVRFRATRDPNFHSSRRGHDSLDDLDFALDALRQKHDNPSASEHTDDVTAVQGLGGLRPIQVERLRALVPDDDGYPRRGESPPTGFELGGDKGDDSDEEEIKIIIEFRIKLRTDRVYFKHHPSLAALEHAAATRCYLCRSLWVLLQPQHSKTAGFWDGLEESHLRHRPERSDLPSLNVYRCRGNMKGVATLEPSCIPVAEVKEPEPERFPSTKAIRRETLDQDLESLIREVIRPWIDGCDTGTSLHQHCQPITQNTPGVLPTRLIDVGLCAMDNVCLVVTEDIPKASEKPKYLTLSYCWGGSNDSAKTTLQNFEERQKNIDTASLPRTIQDAIRLTRAMKIRYLWVDALCIIQNLEDFYLEATKMGSYYANGYCLISASGFSNSSEGLFPDRRARKFSTRTCTFGYDNRRKEYLLLPNPPEDFGVFESGIGYLPVMKRAWCLQERLLSPRILHITARQVIWACHSIPEISERQEIESKADKRDIQRLGEELLKYRPRLTTRYDAIFDQPSMTSMWLAWAGLVQAYLDTELSKEDDRLIAIQGLGDRLAERHNDSYFAGIFLSHLAHGLLWKGEKRPPGQRSTRCPTWSWGMAKSVNFISLECSLASNTNADTTFPSSDGMIEMGSRKMKTLRFSAPLLTIPNTSVVETQQASVSVTWPLRRLKFTLYFDEPSLVPDNLSGVKLMLLGYTDGYNALVGLIVRKCAGNYQFHERVGHVRANEIDSDIKGEKMDEFFRGWTENVKLA